MRCAAFLLGIAVLLAACREEDALVVSHRDQHGRADQWVRRISPNEYQLILDTNGDGKGDLVKTFRDDQLVEIEHDRDYNGTTDLVQEYSHGVLQREIHDDDFDGLPEAVKTFRPNGTLALIERDPTERGSIDIIEYYDAAGHLTRRVVRK